MLTVVTCDIVKFLEHIVVMTADKAMTQMNFIVSAIDTTADFFGLYKIKALGDTYIAVAGLALSAEATKNRKEQQNKRDYSQWRAAVEFASVVVQLFSWRFKTPGEEFRRQLEDAQEANLADKTSASNADTTTVESTTDDSFRQCTIRAGIACGVAKIGVIAKSFDIFGTPVGLSLALKNLAPSTSVHLSHEVYQRVAEEKQTHLVFIARPRMYVKGFGLQTTYFVAKASTVPPELVVKSMKFRRIDSSFELSVRGHGAGAGSHETPSDLESADRTTDIEQNTPKLGSGAPLV
jgi:class 3 adenylate cyclase